VLKLTAHEQPVSRIFSNDYVFRIPPYQRPYAWGTEQVRELLDDLLSFMHNAPPAAGEDMPPYFLGSIVLIKAEATPNAEVVDGQQRLTTLTIILSAIRANVSGNNASDITQLIYEKGSVILGTQDRFRLSLRDRDSSFFQRYVQRENGLSDLLRLLDVPSDSQRNIRENARYINERLSAMSEKERLDLAQFVVTRCYLVVVATPDLYSAYRIFSVLNTRGLDLAATDILKAEIIGGISEQEREAITKTWEDVEEDLGREPFGELFSHIRMVYRKAKPQGTLLEEFKQHVLRGLSPRDFVDDVLLPMATVYEELTDSSYASPERADQINESLRWLNRLEFNDWIPPSLAFTVRNRNDPKLLERYFRDLDRLSYALLIMRSGINERIERYSRITRAAETDDDLFCDASPLQLTPVEQYQTFAVLDGPIYESLHARARTLVLLRLDSLLSGGGARYDYPTVTVEHVLPQTPPTGSQWLSWFPEPEQRTELVHRVGNLVLLTRKKNSAASNYEFARKKGAYFTTGGVSPFAITTQVIGHSEWTPDIVLEMQSERLEKLEVYWRLQDRKGPAVKRDVSVTYEGDGTWRDDVREALRRLGGRASLHRIYQQVEALRRAAGRTTPKTLEAVTRRTLEENSSDSDSFKGGPDLFRIAERKGAGVWELHRIPAPSRVR
jgi:hypothetical protein